MITLDDLLLPPPHQRFLADVLTDTARRRLGTYTNGTFTPHPGREQQAADHIAATVAYLPDVLAGHLDPIRTPADPMAPGGRRVTPWQASAQPRQPAMTTPGHDNPLPVRRAT